MSFFKAEINFSLQPFKFPAFSSLIPMNLLKENEAVRPVPGLSVFKYDAGSIVGVAADHSQAVIILEIQVFFVYLGHPFHCVAPLGRYDGFVKLLLHIFIDGLLRDLLRQPPHHVGAEIIVIDNQGLSIQIPDSLHIIELGSHGEIRLPGNSGIRSNLAELYHLCGVWNVSLYLYSKFII